MIDKIYAINDTINGIVWGPYMVLLLVGVGIYLSVRLGFCRYSDSSIFSNTQ